jgi:hypothetical protein
MRLVRGMARYAAMTIPPTAHQGAPPRAPARTAGRPARRPVMGAREDEFIAWMPFQHVTAGPPHA